MVYHLTTINHILTINHYLTIPIKPLLTILKPLTDGYHWTINHGSHRRIRSPRPFSLPRPLPRRVRSWTSLGRVGCRAGESQGGEWLGHQVVINGRCEQSWEWCWYVLVIGGAVVQHLMLRDGTAWLTWLLWSGLQPCTYRVVPLKLPNLVP